ncbi:hypothetical protein [Actinosynnema sp. NPDC020468]|uniref:hypothetical protein n=1 Tax=Actinosynnema sp. NPDC020468 TaxID=3154488 RepID=UPI0033D1D4DC
MTAGGSVALVSPFLTGRLALVVVRPPVVRSHAAGAVVSFGFEVEPGARLCALSLVVSFDRAVVREPRVVSADARTSVWVSPGVAGCLVGDPVAAARVPRAGVFEVVVDGAVAGRVRVHGSAVRSGVLQDVVVHASGERAVRFG